MCDIILISICKSHFPFLYFFAFHRKQNDTVTMTSHFDLSSPQNGIFSDISSPYNFPCGHTKRASLQEWERVSHLIQIFSFSSRVVIKHFCRETVSINGSPLLYIQGIDFITWMGRHSLFLSPVRADGNEMKLTLDPATAVLTILWPNFLTKEKCPNTNCRFWHTEHEKQWLEILPLQHSAHDL